MTSANLVSPQVLVEESLFILNSVDQDTRYGATVRLDDLVETVGAALSLTVEEYFGFLLEHEYLAQDAGSGALRLTDRAQHALADVGQLRQDVMRGLGDIIDPASSGAGYSPVGGTVEERYERHEEIGSGGIGTVFRGTHLPLKRAVAIKEIRELFTYVGDLRKDEIIHRFEESVQEHASLVHPAIIQILDIDVDQQYPFFVMEYAPGGSLRGKLHGPNKPELSSLLGHFVSIAQALRFAHSQGVVHADLKPENVVFDGDGNAKLVDFAVSRIIETDSSKQQIYIAVGTRAYKAPEQFVNPIDANGRSDIYSLGIMFYEMLTGKLPGRRSPMPSSFFPNIPRKLDDVFDNMCMDAEEDRYASMNDVLEDLLGDDDVLALLGRGSRIASAAAAPPSAPRAPAPMAAAPAAAQPAPAPIPEAEPEPAAPSSSEVSATSHSEVEMEAVSEDELEDSADSIADEPSVADDGDEADAEDAASDADDASAGSSSVLDKLDKYSGAF
jgi:eukaryotic-like serine/threonine-protein kinase